MGQQEQHARARRQTAFLRTLPPPSVPPVSVAAEVVAAHSSVSAVSFPSCEGTLPLRSLLGSNLRQGRQIGVIGRETNGWGSKSNARAPADTPPPLCPPLAP